MSSGGRWRRGEKALLIFQGPHGYVSPRWYRNPVNVPTWNYAVVHAQGTARMLDETGLREHLRALAAKYEPAEGGWDVGALPGEVFDKLATQIIGFDIEIVSIQGKWKMGRIARVRIGRGRLMGCARAGRRRRACWRTGWRRRCAGEMRAGMLM
jgi:transcriptional regulator